MAEVLQEEHINLKYDIKEEITIDELKCGNDMIQTNTELLLKRLTNENLCVHHIDYNIIVAKSYIDWNKIYDYLIENYESVNTAVQANYLGLILWMNLHQNTKKINIFELFIKAIKCGNTHQMVQQNIFRYYNDTHDSYVIKYCLNDETVKIHCKNNIYAKYMKKIKASNVELYLLKRLGDINKIIKHTTNKLNEYYNSGYIGYYIYGEKIDVIEYNDIIKKCVELNNDILEMVTHLKTEISNASVDIIEKIIHEHEKNINNIDLFFNSVGIKKILTEINK